MKTEFSYGGGTLLQTSERRTFRVLDLQIARVVPEVLHRPSTRFLPAGQILQIDGFVRLLDCVCDLVGQRLEVDGRFGNPKGLTGLQEARLFGVAEHDRDEWLLGIEVVLLLRDHLPFEPLRLI